MGSKWDVPGTYSAMWGEREKNFNDRLQYSNHKILHAMWD